MLSRLSVTVALAACVVAVVPLRAQPPAAGMVQRTYQVADLVTPLPEAKVVRIVEDAKADKPEKTRSTREGWLIEQILNTVQPASWAAHDGAGTVDYFPLGGCLVVNQTPEIQQQVAKLLAELRKRQNTQVALEVRILTVSEDVGERIGIDFNTAAGTNETPKVTMQAAAPLCASMLSQVVTPGMEVKFLNDKQLTQLLETAAGDENSSISQSPRITLANAQSGNIHVRDYQDCVTGMQLLQSGKSTVLYPKVESVETGVCFTATPVISADGRFVRVALEFEKKDLVSAEQFPVVIPIRDGEGNFTVYSQYLQKPNVAAIHFSTTTVVPDNGTVMFGGFQREVEVKKEVATPILSRIPYLNRLFTSVGYVREMQRVFVLVTPRIITDEEKEETRPCVTTQAHPLPPTVLPCPVPCTPLAGMTLPSGHYLEHLPQYTPPAGSFPLPCELVPPPSCPVQQASCTVGQTPTLSRQANVVAELLKAYDEACAEGKTAEAKKYAHAALLLDPTCFSKRR